MDSGTVTLWRVTFLAERYGRMTMTLDEVADQIGLTAGTIRNRRMWGDFAWLRTDGRQLYADVADVADVAAYLEQRRTAHAETQSSPPHSASESRPTDGPSRPSGRRRRIQAPESAT